jgi:hypothetical protein
MTFLHKHRMVLGARAQASFAHGSLKSASQPLATHVACAQPHAPVTHARFLFCGREHRAAQGFRVLRPCLPSPNLLNGDERDETHHGKRTAEMTGSTHAVGHGDLIDRLLCNRNLQQVGIQVCECLPVSASRNAPERAGEGELTRMHMCNAYSCIVYTYTGRRLVYRYE